GENAVAVTNYLIDLVKNPNFVHDVNGAGMAGLKDGSIGAIFSGNWDYQNVVDAIGAENVGACQLPTYTLDGEAKQLKAFAGSKAIGVNPNCPDQDVAIALAAWLGGQEAQQAHFDLRGTIPANTTVAASDAVKNNVVATAESSTIANTSIMQPIVGAMGNYWTPATNMADAIISGEVTHDNAAEKTAAMNDAMNGSVVE
ncbi:MAG: extracellular solute-binding protein, partial [Lachnospiraceae bacterium]|nr:extracellular solute-binding protein [Lachnospiraceae bacterium]